MEFTFNAVSPLCQIGQSQPAHAISYHSIGLCNGLGLHVNCQLEKPTDVIKTPEPEIEGVKGKTNAQKTGISLLKTHAELALARHRNVVVKGLTETCCMFVSRCN